MRHRQNIAITIILIPFTLILSSCPTPITPHRPYAPHAPALVPGVNQLDVSWDEVDGATSYQVFYSTKPYTYDASQFGGDITGTSATISGLANGTTYYVWLKACNEAGTSFFSDYSSAAPVRGVPPAPDAPFFIIGNAQLHVYWFSVQDATAYQVFIATTDDTSAAVQSGGDLAATNRTITGLVNGTTYYVWLKAKNEAGTSGFSPSKSGAPNAGALSAPAAPSLTPGAKQIAVSWTSIDGADSYNVFFNTANNTGTATRSGGDIAATSTTITGLADGTRYYVWLTAKNTIGTSPYSPSAAAVTAPGAPAAPSLASGGSQLTATWSVVSGATAYNVFYYTANDSSSADQWGGDIAGTSATITGLANNTPYYVWVRAKNAAGSSGFSPSSSATTSVAPPPSPGAPALVPGIAQIAAAWTTVSGASAYNVFYNTSNNSSSAQQFGGDFTGASATITGLAANRSYWIWLKAKNEGGSSGFSPASTAITAPAAPGAPTVLSGDTTLKAAWSSVAGATAYNVFYHTSNNSSLASQFGGDIAGTGTVITGLANGTLYYVWIKAKNSVATTSAFSAPSYQRPGSSIQELSTAAQDVSRFDGKYIYTLTASQPAAKPQYNGAPSNSYSYAVSTATGTPYLAPGEAGPLSSPGSALSGKAAAVYSSAQTASDAQMRFLENEILTSGKKQLSRSLPQGAEGAAPSPAVVGTPWNGVYSYYSGTYIDTTCRYVSNRALFFVDNNDIAAMESLLPAYGTAFDSMYDTMHSRFGVERDVDGNGKVIVLFTSSITSGILGYFYSADKYPKSAISTSNESDIFYVTANTSYGTSTICGTLAHEFQHMIYYDEHYTRGSGSTYTWLNEALSQAAEYYTGYTPNHLAWISSFLYGNWDGLSLTHWTSSNYGYGATFIRYLIDHYGDEAIKNMCATNLAGIAAVEAATGADFNLIFDNFAHALVLSGTGDSSNPAYAFSTLNLQSTQGYGRGGLLPSVARAAGSGESDSLYPYGIQFTSWTGSFGSMSVTGTDIKSVAYGLNR